MDAGTLKELRAEIRRTGVTPERLQQLADRSDELSKAVAAGPHTPAWLLTQLSRHRLATVRRAVAANRVTPPELLAVLAGDRHTTVVKAVAAHPATEVPVLARLLTAVTSPDSVMHTVLERKSWPVELQWAGARCPDPMCRWTVARRRDLAPEVVEALSADQDSRVLVQLATFHAPELPQAWLREHADSPVVGLRAAVAEAVLGADLLEELLTDDSPHVRAGAVRNPALGPSRLVDLISDAERDPAAFGDGPLFALGFNPNLTEPLRARVDALRLRQQ